MIVGLLLHVATLAQTPVAPSQVTPPTLRPDAPSVRAPVAVPGPAEAVAETADDALDVQVGDVIVDGSLPGFDDAARALQTALAGRRVTLGAIRARARTLEQAYAERGYFLVRVVLPPQRLTDGGSLRVSVVDGSIEAIDASGVPERVRAVVARMLAPLVGRKSLTLDEAERRLLLAGSTAGLSLRSTLAPGDAPGTTRLVLDGRHRLASANLRLGNTQPRSLGTVDLQGTVSLNGALGAGERLYVALGTGRSFFDQDSGHGHLRLFAAGAVVPIAADGWSLNPEFTETVTRPAPEAGALRTRGQLERSALRLARAAIATSQSPGFGGQVAFEHVAQKQTAVDFDVDLSRDSYRVLRFGLDIAAADGGASITYSRGLGGREASDALTDGVPLSRAGAEPRFDRLGASARRSWAFGDGWGLGLIALGQSSFGQPLLTSEQFALSGPDAVSGTTPGSLAVDQGATLRAELGLPAPRAAFGEQVALAPYLFAAAGHGRVFEPTVAERASVSARSTGLGLRVAAGGGTVPMSLQLEAARHFGEPDPDTRRWRAQVTLNLGL